MPNPSPTTSIQQANAPAIGYTGQVVFIYAFDVAYEMVRRPVAMLLGQPVAEFELDKDKRTPRQLSFYRPQMVRLPPIERHGPHGRVLVERTVKLLPVGAISITVRIPFSVVTIGHLVDYHDLQFGPVSLYDEVRQLAEQVKQELMPYYIRPNLAPSEEEAYTVFCIDSPPGTKDGAHMTSEDWLDAHRREVAALLTQEHSPDRLSDQEAFESTGRFLSYYDHDIVVVDWDAALLLDHPGSFDETLHIMELANLQLAELEAYDRMLDDAVERSYRDAISSRVRRRRAVIRQLTEIRIDMARLSDELQNITKFFGDWHLARIYQALSARFHLAEWHRSVDEKLKTLDELYQILKSDQNNRVMLMLEIMIVLLFIVDLVVLVMGLK
jgi:hypothetical protein